MNKPCLNRDTHTVLNSILTGKAILFINVSDLAGNGTTRGLEENRRQADVYFFWSNWQAIKQGALIEAIKQAF